MQTFGPSLLWPRSWEDSRTDLGATFRMLTGRGEIVAGSHSGTTEGREGGGGGWLTTIHSHGGNRPPMCGRPTDERDKQKTKLVPE